MDEDGYVFLVDRKKDMMKTSGFQVWPREIEEVISAHPAVLEVGVAGVPDAVKGEVAKAWVVLKRDVSAPPRTRLRAYCRERLAPYKVPAHVEFRTELPKTMVGKVLRRVLVAETVKSHDPPRRLADGCWCAHWKDADAGIAQRLTDARCQPARRLACRRARRSCRPRARRAIRRSRRPTRRAPSRSARLTTVSGSSITAPGSCRGTSVPSG